jgi:hypothetical protein
MKKFTHETALPRLPGNGEEKSRQHQDPRIFHLSIHGKPCNSIQDEFLKRESRHCYRQGFRPR